jgi:hypothetical protein
VNVYLWMPPGVWLEFGVAKLAPRTPVEVWFQDEMRVGHRRFCPPPVPRYRRGCRDGRGATSIAQASARLAPCPAIPANGPWIRNWVRSGQRAQRKVHLTASRGRVVTAAMGIAQ